MGIKDIIPEKVLNRLWEIVDEVSDECGEEKLNDNFIVKYEGWSGSCIPLAELSLELKKPISKITEEEMKDYCMLKGLSITEEEWKSEMNKKGFEILGMGHEQKGLYGRTWALFIKKKE